MMKNKKLSSGFFIIVGLFLIIIGTFILIKIISTQQDDAAFMSKAESCTAQVTNIKSYTLRKKNSSTGNYHLEIHYDAYVSYTVNGVNYDNVKIPDVSDYVEEGNQLNIYYDSSNPANIRLKSDFTSNTPRIIIAILMIISGIVLPIVRKRRMSKPQPQIYAKNVIPDANSMNSTSTAYNGYDNQPRNFSYVKDIYNPNPEQTYDDYGINPFDTFNGYSHNDNSKPKSPFDKYK